MVSRSIDFTELVLTRRTVAKEQTNLAIELVLAHKSPVAANTLAWAAVEVLNGLGAAIGIQTFHRLMDAGVKPEFKDKWYRKLKAGYNFSKHADRDPFAEITDFRPEATAWTVLAASWNYGIIFQQRSWHMYIFQTWLNCRYPNIVPARYSNIFQAMSQHLEYPQNVPFEESTKRAQELLKQGLVYPEVTDKLLGGMWDIEWE